MYAKLLVKIDLHEPLIRGTRLRCNREMCWINFKYEQLPYFCFYCRKLGHGERVCGKEKEEAKNDSLVENQFGEWLRVQVVRGGSKLRIGGKKDGVFMSPTKEQIRGEVNEVGVEGDNNSLRKREVGRAKLSSENNKIIDMKDVRGDTEGRENNKSEEL